MPLAPMPPRLGGGERAVPCYRRLGTFDPKPAQFFRLVCLHHLAEIGHNHGDDRRAACALAQGPLPCAGCKRQQNSGENGRQA